MVLGWSALLRQGAGGRLTLSDMGSLAALGASTWALYLADRLWDAGQVSTTGSLRVEFAKRNRLLLRATLGVVILATVILILPHLTAGFLGKGLTLGAFVAAYYVFFRGPFAKTLVERFPQLPSKEIMISTCLTAGIFLGSGTPFGSWEMAVGALGVAGLFLGNCLIISRAEKSFDQSQDQAAYFVRQRSARFLPELILALPLLCGGVLLIGSQTGMGPAFLLATGILACAARPRWVPPSHTQAAADGALLVSWLVLASLLIF